MNRQIAQITVGVAIAALGVACGGRTSSVNMTEERTTSSLKGNASPRMELVGCVQPAATNAEGKYILSHVILPPGETGPANPHGSDSLIPRGSWVRLGGPDMHQYLGKEVLISGDLDDAPVGTAGHGGTVVTTEYAQWNTTPADVPLLAVETVKVQADACKE